MNNLSSLINKQILILIILSGFFSGFVTTSHAAGLDDFIITVHTDNPRSSANTEFTIPTTGGAAITTT